ncbi:MAG: NAD-dependent epimerase/dehydratase family protein [Anaerolineae bacterium]|nr:NAD-dependent epimerase/dehydratase family protein [Anaerolineae bacterium]
MHVLITGGAGFIGSALAARLHTLGHTVEILDVFSPQIHGNDPANKQAALAQYGAVHTGDVRDYDTLAPLVQRAGAVVHLAAETGVGQSMYDCRRYVSVNDLGTATLIETLVKESHSVQKVIVTSSRAVYGECAYHDAQHSLIVPPPRPADAMRAGLWEPRHPADGSALIPIPTPEHTPFSPASIYGATKLNQEALCGVLGEMLKIPVVIMRPFNVYGEGQSLHNPYTGILTVFANNIRAGIAPTVYEDGLESRDFVHIDDVVQGIARALGAENLGPRSVFNIGSGERITILELARLMVQAYGADLEPVVSGEFRVGDIRHAFADITHARVILGYAPQVTLADGIRRFAEWTLTAETAATAQTVTIETATEELKRYGLWGQS